MADRFELGLDTFDDVTATSEGTLQPQARVPRDVIEEGILADQPRSGRVFRREGFRNLYNLRGGIDAGSLLADPSVPRY